MAKKTSSKLVSRFLLVSFILFIPVNYCFCVKKQEETQESDTKKVLKKVGLYSLGAAATVNCIVSLAGLYIFLTSLRDIKNSYTKNAAFAGVKKAINYFSSAPQFNKYIIPGITYGLSVNALISLIASTWAFTAGYKTKISVINYAKFKLFPALVNLPSQLLQIPAKILEKIKG